MKNGIQILTFFKFRFFPKVFIKNTKNASMLTILVGRGWLTTYYFYYYRQTDTFVKTVFSDSGGLKTERLDKNFESDFSHIKLIPPHLR